MNDLIDAVPATAIRAYLQRIATGPELSKPLTLAEARHAMQLILAGDVDPVQAGIFLIALRMKRETDDETKGVLEAIRAPEVEVAVDELVDIADPYDGRARSLPVSPFLPSVLAACGVAAYSHGVALLGPKYGVTHHQVLEAAGVDVNVSPQQAAIHLANPNVGWAYLDQASFKPDLHALVELRTQIVKRPVLTTVEVLGAPLRGRVRTHFVTGYVHKPYPRIYALLARHAGFATALLVRGVEGGVVPSLRQSGRLFYYRDFAPEAFIDVEPRDLGIEQSVRAAPIPETPDDESADRATMQWQRTPVVEAAVREGIAALDGSAGPVRDSLIYSAAACLWNVRRFESIPIAANRVREVLDNGAARAHFAAATAAG